MTDLEGHHSCCSGTTCSGSCHSGTLPPAMPATTIPGAFTTVPQPGSWVQEPLGGAACTCLGACLHHMGVLTWEGHWVHCRYGRLGFYLRIRPPHHHSTQCSGNHWAMPAPTFYAILGHSDGTFYHVTFPPGSYPQPPPPLLPFCKVHLRHHLPSPGTYIRGGPTGGRMGAGDYRASPTWVTWGEWDLMISTILGG